MLSKGVISLQCWSFDIDLFERQMQPPVKNIQAARPGISALIWIKFLTSGKF